MISKVLSAAKESMLNFIINLINDSTERLNEIRHNLNRSIRAASRYKEPLSTQVYEWVSANLILGGNCDGLAFHPRGS